ncbi:dehydrodolichyl diphosphate synthase CPT3-like [Cornus florida]|uniref:dehydrodolichyl diphosphate synthase CPT3-like n=1 Tax=Cornus florida TaxID=4283 RepID=UPI0028A28187|nr:dehydrodolichyl diphosphate synthase CPT3-like [Cornus florida]
MDGNRRYAKKRNMAEGAGHKAGMLALKYMVGYCCELGVKYVTIYAFSIENFKRQPEEVEALMDLILKKIEGLMKEDSCANRYGLRVHFAGNLTLLSERIREASKKAMEATAANSKAVLSICVAYTSTDEIANAVQQSCKEKCDKIAGYGSNGLVGGNEEYCHGQNSIKVVDMEKHMYMAIAPDPDILIRTSGETRLSNFLLWQTAYCYIYSPSALWPEIGLRHLVWAILNFQSTHFYVEKKKKQH